VHGHRRVAFSRQGAGEKLRFKGDPQRPLLDELARRGNAHRQADKENDGDSEASHGQVQSRKASVASGLKAQGRVAG
jgi:hypothetical protein